MASKTPVTTERRGGKRAGAGRPKKSSEDMVKPSAYIPQSVYEYIVTLGKGNFSEGIMHLYEQREGKRAE